MCERDWIPQSHHPRHGVGIELHAAVAEFLRTENIMEAVIGRELNPLRRCPRTYHGRTLHELNRIDKIHLLNTLKSRAPARTAGARGAPL